MKCKAIAIVDMPKNCDQCRFLGYFGLTHPYCQLIGLSNIHSLEVDFKNRPPVCPLIEYDSDNDLDDDELLENNIKEVVKYLYGT